MLINGLPPAERAVVGALLNNAGDIDYAEPGDDENRTIQKSLALAHLARISSAALDSCPDLPLFYVHLGASQRSISRDLEDQVRRWKKRRGLGSSKVHTAKLADYLKVWDLREGWTGSRYDRSRERTFRQIAKQLNLRAVSSAVNQYGAAFEMVVGHPFSPELWWRLFGPLKFSGLPGGGDASQILSAPVRRQLCSPVRRPVPDSVVSPSSLESPLAGAVEGSAVIENDIQFRDMLLDLRALIDEGLSDEEIAKRLEIPEPEAVAYFRSRSDEFRGM
jgi:hypothetical protein